MLRCALFFGALALGTALAVGAEPKPMEDLEAFQGNWKPLQIEYQGQSQVDPAIMGKFTDVYVKNEQFKYFVKRDAEGKPILDKEGNPIVFLLAHTNVTLDPKSNPKRYTVEFLEGPSKGKRSHGIYEIAGNQLKLCYGPTELPLPTEFKSTQTNGYFLETWARKPK